MSPLLWHLSFHLIPCGSEGRIEIEPGAARKIGNAELTACWHGHESFDFNDVLERVLPRAEADSSLVRQWGTENAIVVQVWPLVNGPSVYVRIHLVGSGADEVERLARALDEAGLVLVMNDLRVIEPRGPGLMAEINDVSAARFLASPTDFLRDLGAFA